MDEVVYTCPFVKGVKGNRRKPELTCAKEFAEQHHPRLFVETTDDDGNCFFHSLQIYGEKNAYPPLMREIPDLRKELARYARTHLDDILPHLVLNNLNASPMNLVNQIELDGEWDSQIGDIIPVLSAKAFHINLIIYNLYRTTESNRSGSKEPDRISRRVYSSHPSDPLVYVLRIHDGHYQLMSVIDHSNAVIEPHPPLRSSPMKSHHPFKNENEKFQLQNQLNSLEASMNHLYLVNSPKRGHPRRENKPRRSPLPQKRPLLVKRIQWTRVARNNAINSNLLFIRFAT